MPDSYVLKETAYWPHSAITFDDVLIVPRYSDIESRSEIDTSIQFFDRRLDVPIISANMDYVTGKDMVVAMHEAGGLGILNRFMSWEEQLESMRFLNDRRTPFWFSVGIKNLEESISRIVEVVNAFPSYVEGVCIDVAHGHHKKVGELIRLTHQHTGIFVVAGNVATIDGAYFLQDSGADAIKVGIGPGSVCTTRTVTGVGMPQLSTILHVARSSVGKEIPIIADGGIRSSGDIAKAIIAGASAVMIGSLIAGATECPSPVLVGGDGQKYRPYQGQSIFGSNGERFVKEGIQGFVPDKGPVSGIIHSLQAGLRSAMSYTGSRNLQDFRNNAKMTLVSPSTIFENNTRVRTTI